MANPTVAENIVDILVHVGVKQVFGVVGDALNSFTDAIRRKPGIDWIGVRHEEVAAFAAGAQAQITGTLGVCAGTVGPGAIHLLNGLYDAKKSYAPVLAITGQVPLAELGSNYFQEVNLDNLFRDVSVYNQTIVTPHQVPRVVQLAIQSAMVHKGVSTITLPGDIGLEKIPNDGEVDFFFRSCETEPVPWELEKAVALINGGEKITVLAGAGCRNAREEILALCEKLKSPLVYALRGKEILEADNPYAVGMTGLIGTPAGAAALDSCDVLLLVGTDFPYRDWYPKHKKVIQIDNKADHLGRRHKIDVGLIGGVRGTLRALVPQLNAKTDQSHLKIAQEKKQKWESKSYKHTSLEKHAKPPVRPELVAQSLSDLAADDAVFTADVGMCTVWAARHLQMKRGQRLLGSFNHGSMANAMPQALGVQAIDKNRQVISLSGDGGLSMLMGDLITAVSYDLPIKVVVFHNNRLGMVKLEMETGGVPEYGTVLKNPNFAKVADAMGLTGIHVTDPAEVKTALKRALETDGPVLVDVETNPDELSFPPKFLPDKAWGFALGKIKETLTGYRDPFK